MRRTASAFGPPQVFLEPGVRGIGRAGEGLGTGPTPAPEPARSGVAPHPPELLAVAPDDPEGRLPDIPVVEAGPEEAARVHVALHRNRADVVAGPAGVAGVDLRLSGPAGLRAERVEP